MFPGCLRWQKLHPLLRSPVGLYAQWQDLDFFGIAFDVGLNHFLFNNAVVYRTDVNHLNYMRFGGLRRPEFFENRCESRYPTAHIEATPEKRQSRAIENKTINV